MATRLTKKYAAALTIAKERGVPPSAQQDELYRRLNDDGCWWDSKQGKWVVFAEEPADAPTPLIMVRVWAAETNIKAAVSTVCGAFGNGFKKILASDEYPCRPPKQLERRVYLQFVPMTAEMTKQELIRENDPYAIDIE